MTGHVDRDAVVDALTARDVVDHLGIKGEWRGRWLRSQRCPVTDHNSEAFGISRDGKMHCWSCGFGGGLLDAVALGNRLATFDGAKVTITDFPKVLEIAAGLAGVDLDPGADFFGTGPVKPPRVERPPMFPLPSLYERVVLARRRAAWVWGNLQQSNGPAAYLRSRGLDPAIVLRREELRCTPVSTDKPAEDANQDQKSLWWTMGPTRGTLAVVVPVRACTDGHMIDLRCRRVEPLEGQPKIIGMVGGITSAPAERGKTRQLIGCYGRPHSIDSDLVVVVEGAMDYLTALQVWPNAQVLGAVEAGSLALVAGWAARVLAERDETSRLIIVEQADPPRTLHDGTVVAGAADEAINEQPNAATKVALRLLRNPKRLGWLFCEYPGDDGKMGTSRRDLEGKPVKDLNDLVKIHAAIWPLISWWSDLASTD